MTGYLGLDLAWGARGRTGWAVLDERGRFAGSGAVRTDAEIDAVIDEVVGTVVGTEVQAVLDPVLAAPLVVAIDAPLLVPNATGRRRAEAEVAALFGPYDAGPYPSNRSHPWFDPPRAQTLAERHGWVTDPTVRPGSAEAAGRTCAVEVYPHPAMVVLFGLDRVLPYKVRPDRGLEQLRTAHRTLLAHLERVLDPVHHVTDHPRWAELEQAVAQARTVADLRRHEDEVDAVLCAHLAWLWDRAPERMAVHGAAAEGHIVVPTGPLVPPAPRVRRPAGSSPAGTGARPRRSRA